MDYGAMPRTTLQTRRILDAASAVAQAHGSNEVNLLHVMYGLLVTKDTVAYNLLGQMGVDISAALERLAVELHQQSIVTPNPTSDAPMLSSQVAQMLTTARRNTSDQVEVVVGADDLLLAVVASTSNIAALFGGADVSPVRIGELQQRIETLTSEPPYSPSNRYMTLVKSTVSHMRDERELAYVMSKLKSDTRHEKESVLVSHVRVEVNEHPTSIALRLFAARLLREASEFEEAMSHLGIAVVLDPDGPRAYKELAAVARLAGMSSFADRVLEVGWERYVKLIPDDHLVEDKAFWFS